MKHGLVNTPAWNIYKGMMNRCNSPSSPDYPNYGGRGIKVCPEWNGHIEKFWEDMGPTYKPGLQLDRIDVNGHYEKKNCRWATPKQNSNNKRTNHYVDSIYGHMTVTQLAELTRMSPNTLANRLNAG